MASTKPKGSGLGGIKRKERPATPTQEIKEEPPEPPAAKPAPAAVKATPAPARPKSRAPKTTPSPSAADITKVTLPLDGDRHQTLRRLGFEHETTHRAVLFALLDIAGGSDDISKQLNAAIGERTAGRALEQPRGPAPQSKSY